MRKSMDAGYLAVLFVSLVFSAIAMVGCGGSGDNSVLPNVYTRTNLVSDIPNFTDSAGTAAHTDANLKNPWGVAFSAAGPFWVSDNGTGVTTLYDSAGVSQAPVVGIPTPSAITGGAVTGQVFNNTGSFAINGTPALFIFVTEGGTVSGWNAGTGTNAILKVNNSGSGAVYKGIALGNTGLANFIYAANFHAGTIDVFDTNFSAATLSGTFTDPTAPAGFAPFNIANIGGQLFVTYAKQDGAKHDDVAGAGNGFISVFETTGAFIRRLATGSGAGGTTAQLNSPWGMAMAPSGFGQFQNSLLVGNFGDGHISAFNSTTGAFLGQLQTSGGSAITIPGLWALTFGNGGTAGPTNTLFFTAGINDEADGLFGSIVAGSVARSARR